MKRFRMLLTLVGALLIGTCTFTTPNVAEGASPKAQVQTVAYRPYRGYYYNNYYGPYRSYYRPYYYNPGPSYWYPGKYMGYGSYYGSYYW